MVALSDSGDAARESARRMNDNEWSAFMTRQAALAIAHHFEARGRLDRPIKNLTMQDLETIADRAIARFVVLGSIRLSERGKASGFDWLMQS